MISLDDLIGFKQKLKKYLVIVSDLNEKISFYSYLTYRRVKGSLEKLDLSEFLQNSLGFEYIILKYVDEDEVESGEIEDLELYPLEDFTDVFSGDCLESGNYLAFVFAHLPCLLVGGLGMIREWIKFGAPDAPFFIFKVLGHQIYALEEQTWESQLVPQAVSPSENLKDKREKKKWLGQVSLSESVRR